MTTTENKTRIPVIFILSPGHSGSTLLDLLISGHSEIVTGGEFNATPEMLQRSCTCGAETIYACDFWISVDEQLHAAGYRLDTLLAHESNTADFAAFNRVLLNAIRKISGASMVMDSSKRRRKRLRKYNANRKQFAVHLILLAREPLRTVASYKKKGFNVFLTCLKLNAIYAQQLYYAFFAASFVRYETLVQAPRATLARIMDHLGYHYEDSQLDLDRNKFHNMGGNRFRKHPVESITIDKSWKTRLTGFEKIMTVLLTLPARIFARLAGLVCWLRGRNSGYRNFLQQDQDRS